MYPHAKEALRNGIESISIGSGVHGDVAEFGCYQGRTAGVLAEAMTDCDHTYGSSNKLHGISQRKLWLLDSFKGLPAVTHPADVNSPHLTSGVWREGAISNTTQERVQGFVEQFIPKDRIKVIPGFFNQSMIEIPATTRFAFVHMDCNYYKAQFRYCCIYAHSKCSRTAAHFTSIIGTAIGVLLNLGSKLRGTKTATTSTTPTGGLTALWATASSFTRSETFEHEIPYNNRSPP